MGYHYREPGENAGHWTSGTSTLIADTIARLERIGPNQGDIVNLREIRDLTVDALTALHVMVDHEYEKRRATDA